MGITKRARKGQGGIAGGKALSWPETAPKPFCCDQAVRRKAEQLGFQRQGRAHGSLQGRLQVSILQKNMAQLGAWELKTALPAYLRRHASWHSRNNDHRLRQWRLIGDGDVNDRLHARGC